MAESMLDKLVRVTSSLAPMPPVAGKLLELMRDPEVVFEDVMRVLRQDTALVTKILTNANSAYYGRSRKVTSLDNPVVHLGFRAIDSMVIALSTGGFFRASRWGHGLWDHALATAFICRELARGVEDARPEDAFIVGLLHDVGKIILSQKFEKHFARALERMADAEGCSEAVEREIFRFDHAELGGRMLEKWNFPELFCHGVAHHHQVLEIEDPPVLASLACLADVLATQREHNVIAERPMPDGLLELLELDLEEVDKTTDQALVLLQDERSMFS